MKDARKTKSQLIKELELLRKQAEEKLFESGVGFKTIFEESPIGIEIYDRNGVLTHANTACLDIFGVKDENEVIGFNLFEDPNVTDEMKQNLSDLKPAAYETTFDFEKVKALKLYKTSKSGLIDLSIEIFPLFERINSSLNGYLVNIQDITKCKHAEEAF